MNDSFVEESTIHEKIVWCHDWRIPNDVVMRHVNEAIYKRSKVSIITVSSRLHKLWPGMFIEMRINLDMRYTREKALLLSVEIFHLHQKQKLSMSIRFSVEHVVPPRATALMEKVFTTTDNESSWISIGNRDRIICHCDYFRNDLVIKSEARCKMELTIPIDNHYRIYDRYVNFKIRVNSLLIMVHRHILMKHSYFFKRKFMEDVEQPGPYDEIDVDENFIDYMFMLRFFYNTLKDEHWNNVNYYNLYHLGQRFKAHSFIKACEEKIVETLNDDLIGIYVHCFVTDVIRSTKIQQAVLKYIRNNKERVIKTGTWKQGELEYKEKFNIYLNHVDKLALCNLDKDVIIEDDPVDDDSDLDNYFDSGNENKLYKTKDDTPTITVSKP